MRIFSQIQAVRKDKFKVFCNENYFPGIRISSEQLLLRLDGFFFCGILKIRAGSLIFRS